MLKDVNKRPTIKGKMVKFLSSHNKHKRQKRIVKYFLTHRPKIMLLSGSVRSGKTYVLIMIFIMMLIKNRGKGKMYLIGGKNQGAIWRNVILDINKIFGITVTLDRSGCFELFGNKILVAEGGLAGSNEKIRGFTLSGALLNEGTTLNHEYIQEVQNRLSDSSEWNGWLLIDTNPDSKQSYVYQNFVLKSGETLSTGRVNVKAFTCTLVHNPYVTEEYKESLKMSTPDGHMYERMINGEWANSSGLVYKNYDPDKQVVDGIPKNEVVVRYVGGMDWGWIHPGVFTLFAVTNKNKYYLIDEYVGNEKHADWFAEHILECYKRFGYFDVYCDTASPAYISIFNDRGISALNANKSVIEGITHVSKLLKLGKLFFIRSSWNLGHKEMDMYSWKNDNSEFGSKDEPIKLYDDAFKIIGSIDKKSGKKSGTLKRQSELKLNLKKFNRCRD